jgi:hypothetical protein
MSSIRESGRFSEQSALPEGGNENERIMGLLVDDKLEYFRQSS